MLNWQGWAANFLGWATASTPAPTPAPSGGGGRARRRIWVEIKNGQVYEAQTPTEAVEVVRKIKRTAKRKLNVFKRGGIMPALPEIVIKGEDVPTYLRERVDEVNDELEALYARAVEEDEDEALTVLLH